MSTTKQQQIEKMFKGLSIHELTYISDDQGVPLEDVYEMVISPLIKVGEEDEVLDLMKDAIKNAPSPSRQVILVGTDEKGEKVTKRLTVNKEWGIGQILHELFLQQGFDSSAYEWHLIGVSDGTFEDITV